MTLTCEAYNKVLAWKTTQQEDGSAWPTFEQIVILAVMQNAKDAFTDANYSSLEKADQVEKKDDLTAKMRSSTAVFALTHGQNSAVQDSPPPGLTAHWIGWIEFDRNKSPLGYTSAIFYSCATIFPNLFQWDWMGLRAQDAAYGGFDQKIQTYYRDRDGNVVFYLHEHSQRFFEDFAMGMTAEAATVRANIYANAALINVQNRPAVVLQIKRDPYMTLKYVYLTPGERQQLNLAPNAVYDHWFYPPLRTP